MSLTIDERLEKLAERHEALTQSIELQRLADRERHEALAMSLELLTVDVRQLTAEQRRFANTMSSQMSKATTLIGAMAEGITGLTAIMSNHDQRLSNLEG